MLQALDDSAFEALEGAYGAAIDVPALLRTIAHGTREEGRRAVDELGAHVFHGGVHYPAAAPTVPFLVEIAAAGGPSTADVLLLLADLAGAPKPPSAYDRQAFGSSPGAPDDLEAVETVLAIAAARPVALAALRSPVARVRGAAAFLLAALEPDAAALRAALDRETDESAAITLRFALAHARAPQPLASSGRIADVARALGTEDGAGRLDALARLLLEPVRAREELPFTGGDLASFAARALAERAEGPERADAFAALRDALHARLARGERIRGPEPLSSERVGDPPLRVPVAADDTPLRVLAQALTELAFGERARGPLLVREELDARQREVLALTRDHGIPLPLPAAPWIEPARMARFLAGGGPLDRELDLDGARAPLYVHLHPLVSAPFEPGAEARADLVLARLASTWEPDSLFELVVDVLENAYGLAPYGAPSPPLDAALARHVEPALTSLAERCTSLAASLRARDRVDVALARFALRPWIERLEPPPPSHDRLVRSALAVLGERGRRWLAAFPEPRRSSLVAGLGSTYLADVLGPACDPVSLAHAIVDAFLAPDCAWLVHEAERLLMRVPVDALEQLHRTVGARRRAIVRRALRERTGVGVLVLALRLRERSVHALLRDWTGRALHEAELSPQPRLEELLPFVEASAEAEDALLDVAGDVDGAIEDRVVRLLKKGGFRGTIRCGAVASASM